MKASKIIYVILIILVLGMIAGVIFYSSKNISSPNTIPDASVSRDTPAPLHIASLLEEDESVSCDIIEDGLRDMGKLITEEYYFTEVVSYSNIKKLFNISLGFTESGYIISYDGTITAGIDFTAIDVEVNENTKSIKIILPKSEIISTEIDPDSFELFSEKEGLWNKLSVEDYNTSLTELTNNARQKAIEKGLLEKADENAKNVIKNFVMSLINTNSYTVSFITK